MISEFARRIKPAASLERLAWPPLRIETLRAIAASARNTGIMAVFTGSKAARRPAAEALAHELHADVYRVDLAAVASKWIGETEKELSRLIDEAGTSGAVLLFDEADALFGKRTELKDSHDRFAASAALFDRIESSRALAIWSAATKDSLDLALLARAKFIVDFPD
jgi:AAA+ superfamily predicted ATPase